MFYKKIMYSYTYLFQKGFGGDGVVSIYLKFFRKVAVLMVSIHYMRGELSCESGDQDSSVDLPLTCSKTLV